MAPPEEPSDTPDGDENTVGETIVVIPARYDSERFPGKVLANATGKPLIQHVYEQAALADVSRVLVAADDDRVVEAVRGFGGDVVMTRPDHVNGTCRIAEATEALPRNATIVNVQGDEPEVSPASIDLAVLTLTEHDDCAMSTLASPIGSLEDLNDPNVVKVVVDQSGRAVYFSRAPIPHDRGGQARSAISALRHIGLYVYRRDFLLRYVTLPPTPLEQAERLEQLRAIEHGYRIAVAITDCSAVGIDTPQQYDAFVERYRAQAG